MLVNSSEPNGEAAQRVCDELQSQYGIAPIAVNCLELDESGIADILQQVLYEFPVSEVQFFIPKWVEMLPRDHKIKQDMLVHIKEVMDRFSEIKDAAAGIQTPESPYIDEMKVDQIEMDTGCVKVRISVADRFYYEMLSELTGTHIAGQYELIAAMRICLG